MRGVEARHGGGLGEHELRALSERQARRQEPVERPVVRLVLALQRLVVVDAPAEEEDGAIGVAADEAQLEVPSRPVNGEGWRSMSGTFGSSWAWYVFEL